MARVLALEPYYGGSHQAFVDGWIGHSRHHFTLLSLKAHHWKWRMRHAAVTLAQQCRTLPVDSFDMVWVSSMCNVAEFMGLCPPHLRGLPLVVYFHENQLAYPSQRTDPRDVHFAFTNWTSALAATAVWFNSAHNRDSLLTGLEALFRRLPDHRDAFESDVIANKTRLLSPGIDEPNLPQRLPVATTAPRPLHIAWAARFEHDKGPEVLHAALTRLKHEGVAFSLTVMGQQFASCPDALTQIQSEFASELQHFGYEPERARYWQRLASADVFVSTAQHEFFGLSVLEAARAGCSLLLPRRLSYPELFEAQASEGGLLKSELSGSGSSPPQRHPHVPLFYDGSADDLASALKLLAHTPPDVRPTYADVAARHVWPLAARTLDLAVDALVTRR